MHAIQVERRHMNHCSTAGSHSKRGSMRSRPSITHMRSASKPLCAGGLFFLLGFLAVALQADYPVLCAWGGLDGDYRKAAHSLSKITGWSPETLLTFWALSFLAVPVFVFSVAFWLVRARRVRRLRRAHVTRMLCNLPWVAAACKSGDSGASSGILPDRAAAPAISSASPDSKKFSRGLPRSRMKVCNVHWCGGILRMRVVPWWRCADGPLNRAVWQA